MINSFIAVNFLFFVFSHPDALICESGDRNAVCPPSTGEPVCAVYSGGDCQSSTGYCLREVDSDCNACLDGAVAGFVYGECSQLNVQSCSDEHDTVGCHDVLGAACGITQSTSSSEAIIKTKYSDGCGACDSGAEFYVNGDYWGQCQVVSNSPVCKAEDRGATDCQAVGTLACAYYTGGDCTEPICRKTTDGYCFACAEENVMFYQIGDCADLVPIGPGGSEEEYEEAEEQEHVEEHEEEEIVDPCLRRRLLLNGKL